MVPERNLAVMVAAAIVQQYVMELEDKQTYILEELYANTAWKWGDWDVNG